MTQEEVPEYNPMKKELANIERRLTENAGRTPPARKSKTQWGPLYTMVFWPVLDCFDLSPAEYNLADAIDKLSGRASPVPGWCVANKDTLAELTRVAPATVYRALKALREKELVEDQPKRKDLLRPTEKWVRAVELCERRMAAKRRQ